MSYSVLCLLRQFRHHQPLIGNYRPLTIFITQAPMFDGIKKFFCEVRIKADFPQYESSKLQARTAESARRFDTAQLEREVADIKDKTCHAANEKFGVNTNELNGEITVIEKDIRRTRGNLAIFERDYKSELNDLHTQKDALLEEKDRLISELRALKEARSGAQESLQDAYDRLESAKNAIDRWYGKSDRTPWLLGNGGKKLPKHSMFGQSFGDLDEYKRDRGDAVSDIVNCKEKIDEIKSRQRRNKEHRDENKAAVTKVFEQINETKATRQLMYELKQHGMKYFAIKKELSAYLSFQADLQNRLHALESERNEFTKQMKYRLGINEREAKIAEIRALKAQFMEEFHSLSNQELRRADHRKQWMSEHGMKQKS
jgi:chromosome segregation ATPase